MECMDNDTHVKSAAHSETDFENEVVWSVGDQCRAKWSGDDKYYDGIIRKVNHIRSGAIKALIKFNNYDSEDNEEVDVHQLQKILKKKPVKTAREKTGSPDKDESQEGLFKPFTGTEDIIRIEDKYGQESDSDSSEQANTSDWISSSRSYQTKGRISEWRIRSPAKSQKTSRSQRGRSTVVQGGSLQKKPGAGRRSKPDAATPQAEVGAPLKREGTAALNKESTVETQNSRNTRTRHDDPEDMLVPPAGDVVSEGFDEEDLEKPKFNFPAPSPKLPFCLSDSNNVKIPATLNQYLRDYQREGIQFLYSHYAHKKGAILGDDMGLGKTVQVIGFLSALMEKEGNRMDVMRQKPRFIRLMSDTPNLAEEKKCNPFLIIGPGSVLYNWLEELDTWAHVTVRKYHGADKASCLADVARGKVEVVVTTFETCRDNVVALNRVEWEAVIVDEAHRIKGLKAQTTQALRNLKCIRRYGLTGTALQNNMTELWCILDWAQPGVLGSAEEFNENFVHPIEQGQKQNATKRELAEARRKKEEFAKVRCQMLLRRTKKLIADQLPKKTDRVVLCRLTPMQVDVYQAILNHPHMHSILSTDSLCVCGSGRKRGKCCFKKLPDGQSPKSAMFSFMHVLLKVSNHSALLIPHANMSPEVEKRAKALCEIAFKEHPEFVALARDAAFRTLSDPKYCGKMKVLQGLLSVFTKSHSKVLVFSYSTRLLDILEQHIMSEGSEYRRIDGGVTGRRRQEIVREFNSDPNIFLCLISTKAGGLGLNLTGANKVIIFDPNWNPSHDLQAQDRAYRIGQRRDVEVYRLVSAGTIEENIYLRQIYKQQLDNVAIGSENARRYFKGIQGDAGNKGELFGVKNMFQLRTGDSCLTVDILNRNSKMEANIAGYAMADYIPSRQEQRNADDSIAGEDSDAESFGDVGESSDEETLDVFRDLLDAVSDVDDDSSSTKGRQLQIPQTNKDKSPDASKPKPSISGLHTPSKKKKISGSSKASSGSKRHAPGDITGLDSHPGESTPKQSRPTTWQRQAQWKQDTIVLQDDRASTSGALDFVDNVSYDDDNGVDGIKNGKAVGEKPVKRTVGKPKGLGNVHSSEVEDSLITPSFSSVSAVFEQCGVIHYHDNPQVVGASRVEDHMTRCAMQDVFELSTNTQAPALMCDPMSQPSDEEQEGGKASKNRGPRGRTIVKDHNSARTVDHGRWHILVGQTPVAIKKKQWQQLKELKKENEVLLAQRVVQASPEERLSLLQQLYREVLDKGLHEALDDTLSIPAVPQPVADSHSTVGSGRARARARARKMVRGKSAAAKNQQRKGQRKITKTRASTAKKQRVKRKVIRRGLAYDDSDDTQDIHPSQFPRMQLHDADDQISSDDSGFEIGAKISPAKMRATQRKSRSGASSRTRKQQQITSSPAQQATTQQKHAATHKVPGKVSETESHADTCYSPAIEDVDCLLRELGKKRSDVEAGGKVEGSDIKPNTTMSGFQFTRTAGRSEVQNLSVLDEIFCESEDIQKSKRKPPPQQGQRQSGQNNSPAKVRSALDSLDISGVSALSVAGKPSTTSSTDEFSDLMNNSTLADDDVDCFGEPTLWKKKHNISKKPVNKMDRLLKKTTDDYLQLFESGRLVKKYQRETGTGPERGRRKHSDKEVSNEESRGTAGSELDPSASLF